MRKRRSVSGDRICAAGPAVCRIRLTYNRIGQYRVAADYLDQDTWLDRWQITPVAIQTQSRSATRRTR